MPGNVHIDTFTLNIFIPPLTSLESEFCLEGEDLLWPRLRGKALQEEMTFEGKICNTRVRERPFQGEDRAPVQRDAQTEAVAEVEGPGYRDRAGTPERAPSERTSPKSQTAGVTRQECETIEESS